MPAMPPFAFGRAETLARGDLLAVQVRYPRPSRLEQPLEVKPARAAKAVESLGIDTRADLLEHLPFRHEDRREARDVGSLAVGEEASVVVTVKRIARRPTRRRRLTIVEATVADETGPMKAVFFNQPWLVDRLPEGTVAVLHGRYQGGKKGFVVSEYEIARGPSAGDLHSTGLVPVYPATEGVDSKKLRELAFGIRGLVHDAIDPLPGRLRAGECLPDRPAALAAVHFPEREGDDTAARERLAFDELLGLELGLLVRRQARRSAGAPPLGEPGELTERWLREGLPFELTGDQRKAIETLDRELADAQPAQRLLMGEVGSGKAQPLDALVLTPAGFRRMGEIRVGHELVSPSGDRTHVVGVYPQGEREVWRVTFSDGSAVECDADHLWRVQTSTARCRGDKPKVMALREIASDLRRPSGAPKWHVEFPKAADLDGGGERPIDPYLLGLLLGDGGLSLPDRVRFTSADPELVQAVERALPPGCVLRKSTSRPYDWNIIGIAPPVPGKVRRQAVLEDPPSLVPAYQAGASANTIASWVGTSASTVRLRLLAAGVEMRDPWRKPSPLAQALASLDLMRKRAREKSVPAAYLNAPIKERHALLQGLMDTDGTVGTHGMDVSFVSASRQLAQDMAWLVRSLNGRARCRARRKAGGTYWHTSVALPANYPPFRLARKAQRVRPKTKYAHPAKAIVGVESVGRKPVQCIAVAHPDQLYVTDDFTVTHNTVVALHAMLRAVEKGMQAALMAPTETLAEQHFATLERLSAGVLAPIALLTGSTPPARRVDVLAKLASGELSLVVGTHALLEDPVEFDRLGVVVVDEQHRFGVGQRRALDKKGGDLAPHRIHMTATPIPRTLALSLYGDLDVTLLRELPAGRRPVETFLASGARERARAYERIREELRAGHQAFVVCPLVEESEALQARAATKEFERLRDTEFRDFKVVLMHGQLKHREKQAAMAAFANGEADVLVATSVIEVGIDVPNATVMLVEDAERYGISQLHQLRGRVGRGEHDSVCLLFGSKEGPRLRALAKTNDGFELAEVDLKIRGEGELLGMRQSGLQEFRAARLPDDAELLERARLAARSMLDQDPELSEPEHALLATTLGDRESGALEPIPA